jgi:flap endonuclease-1
MGIRDLNYLIKRYTKNSIKEITLYDLRGKRIAIDLQLYLYKAIIHNKNPVEEIYRQILHLDRYRIKPVYVFDGKPPKEKWNELHKRALKRSRSLEVIDYLESVYLRDRRPSMNDDETHNLDKVLLDNKITELKKNSISIDRKTKTTIKYLCQVMGVEYIDTMDMEADKAIGILYKDGKIDGCISEDNDMLVYGCKHLYRFYKTNSNHILEYNLEEIRRDLQLTQDEFLDLCILSGSDYYKNIRFKTDLKNSVVAYYLIKKYKTLENIGKQGYLPDNLNYNKIRQIYSLTEE